jgi:hypothetical protein
MQGCLDDLDHRHSRSDQPFAHIVSDVEHILRMFGIRAYAGHAEQLEEFFKMGVCGGVKVSIPRI